MALSFVIVGKKELVYECRLGSGPAREESHVHQFVLHSALDIVEEKMWYVNSMLLNPPPVDEFNDLHVHGWVTANGAKLLLLHESIVNDSTKRSRVEDSIRNFFEEVNDLFTKIVLNPFYEPDMLVTSKTFDQRVKSAAVKWGLA